MQNIKEKLLSFVTFINKNIAVHQVIAVLAAAFCTASIFSLPFGDFTKLDYFKTFSPVLFIACFVVSFIAYAALSLKFGDRASSLCVLITTVLLALFLSVYSGGNIYMNIGLAAVIFVSVKYSAPRIDISFELSFKSVYIISAAAALIMCAVTFLGTYFKYASFSSSTYDFGIFAQMYEMMKDTGLPYTTVERGELLSHFAVHFSPVFYLFLPGYFLMPGPEYLILIQAAAVAAGVFPVIGIARRLGLCEKYSLAAGMFYLLFPSVINGCYYDFHENKFLAVIALYLIYFILSEKTVPMYIFAALLLSVKEDAAIYAAAIALWMIFSGTRREHGFGILAVSVVYFASAVSLISIFGGEVMMGRLSAYYPEGEQSFFAVIKTCFFNIGYLFKQVFTADKIPFILWMLVPAAAAPFVLKKSSSLLLMIPMLVINLMPDWKYQYDIDFQYTYGVAALVVFCFIMLLAESAGKTRRRIALFSLCTALVFSMSLWVPKFQRYADRYISEKETYDNVAQAMYDIPEDATVTTSNFLMPHLFHVDEIYGYPLYYGELRKTDYYIIDTRYHDADKEDFKEILDDGYVLEEKVGFAEIYRLSK